MNAVPIGTASRGDVMEPELLAIREDVVEGNRSAVEAAIRHAMNEGLPPVRILNDGLIAAMTEVGERFERQEFYVPEMLVAARAMRAGLAILKPKLIEGGIETVGRVVLGTVKGDLHDIGKNLVGMMLEGAGFEIVDLGTDVSPDKFVAAVKSTKVDILALSALLTTTMPNMKATIDALKLAGGLDQIKVIVGGAPLTDQYARQIGADGYAPDASRAVVMAKSLLATSGR